jgi:predicted short-subunit dehydrogenase-like oxidoreductase (DUF2520 family)
VTRYHISFAGAGRVASSLCTALYQAGHTIDTVVSEKGLSARKLASLCNAEWSDELIFPASTRIIIVSVPDHKLTGVLEEIRYSEGTLIAHTAGSFGLDVFPETITDRGVLYPLQTFSPGRKIDFSGLPFIIESDLKQSEQTLTEIALSLGGKTHFMGVEMRRKLHLAAVFVCNFTNHMFTSGKEIADKSGISFDIFKHLIMETVSKALAEGPERSQTGPAVRNDRNTIEKHLELLSDSPGLKELYATITESIMKYYKKDQRG